MSGAAPAGRAPLACGGVAAAAQPAKRTQGSEPDGHVVPFIHFGDANAPGGRHDGFPATRRRFLTVVAPGSPGLPVYETPVVQS